MSKYELHLGDCLEVMRSIPDGSVDMVLCDLPYGMTACKWDSVIPFEPLWEQYKRVAKDNAAIVLTAGQPFTSALVMSNPKWFRYQWVWDKKIHSGMSYARFQPMRQHEDVLVFCGGRVPYHPQITKREKPIKEGGREKARAHQLQISIVWAARSTTPKTRQQLFVSTRLDEGRSTPPKSQWP